MIGLTLTEYPVTEAGGSEHHVVPFNRSRSQGLQTDKETSDALRESVSVFQPTD